MVTGLRKIRIGHYQEIDSGELPCRYGVMKNDDGIIKYECIGSIEELKKKATNFDEVYNEKQPFDLHLPYIDNLKVLSETGKLMKREPVVIDCWFDSGSMPFAQYHYPFENKELFEHNYPADFIAEGLDQTTRMVLFYACNRYFFI